MATHELKTWPEPFAAILSGAKRHEVRKNDRGYAVGDVLHLREYALSLMGYTGRELHVLVTHLTRGGTWGLPADLCVMSVERSVPAFTPEEREALEHARLSVSVHADGPLTDESRARYARTLDALDRLLASVLDVTPATIEHHDPDLAPLALAPEERRAVRGVLCWLKGQVVGVNDENIDPDIDALYRLLAASPSPSQPVAPATPPAGEPDLREPLRFERERALRYAVAMTHALDHLRGGRSLEAADALRVGLGGKPGLVPVDPEPAKEGA